MARPIKEGLDYFPLDCHMNDAMKLIQAEFGLVGYAVVIKLWQKIYSDKGYYTKWGRDVALLFAQDNSVGGNVVQEVVRICLQRGIFDQAMFKEHGILTSDGIQKRFAEGTARRTSVKIDRRYLLIVAPKNWVFVDNNSINVDNNTQRKVKESKVNSITLSDTCACVREEEDGAVENPVENSVENSEREALKLKYLGGTLGGGVVLISDAQFESLCEELSLEELERYLAVVRDCEKKGKRYKKSHYQAILDMARADRRT